MMKSILVIIVAIFLTSCSDADQPRQAGYFKSASNDRIFTASFSGELNAADAEKWAMNRPNTIGQMTAVYVYPADQIIPKDAVTQAANVFDANAVIFSDAAGEFKYVLMRSRNGTVQFLDCGVENSDLCK